MARRGGGRERRGNEPTGTRENCKTRWAALPSLIFIRCGSAARLANYPPLVYPIYLHRVRSRFMLQVVRTLYIYVIYIRACGMHSFSLPAGTASHPPHDSFSQPLSSSPFTTFYLPRLLSQRFSIFLPVGCFVFLFFFILSFIPLPRHHPDDLAAVSPSFFLRIISIDSFA